MHLSNKLYSSVVNEYTELYVAMLTITDPVKNNNHTNLNPHLAVVCVWRCIRHIVSNILINISSAPFLGTSPFLGVICLA